MQTPTGPAFPFLSPVIRALLSTKRDSGHRDVPRDKAIRGNFSDGQVYGEREWKGGKRTLVSCSNISQCGQRDAKECVKRMRVPQLSEKYLRKILGLVLARERF